MMRRSPISKRTVLLFPATTLYRSLPNRVRQIEINTVGAGGGSVAYLDAGGFLNVGPRSAGAMPGPAAYGRGGTEPTVTDRSAEHTSELQSLMRISYAVFCFKKKINETG